MTVIVSRSEWRARRPFSFPPPQLALPSLRLWLHHTATDAWHGASGVRSCQSFHMDDKGWNDIGYSFLVDTDGTIYEGRGAGIVGAHTEGDNSKSHGICCMGNFSTVKPPDVMVRSVAALVRQGLDEGWWQTAITGGHRDAPGAQTSCPGDGLLAAIPHINALASEGDDDGMAGWTEQDSKNLAEGVDLLRQINHQLNGDARLKAIAADVDRIADKIVRPD